MSGCGSCDPWTPPASWGAVRSQVEANYCGNTPAHCPITYTGQNTSDVTPNYIWSLTYETSFFGPRTMSFVFTPTCGSGTEWNAEYGGCAEQCDAPDTLNTTTGMCESPPDCGDIAGAQVDRFFTDTGPGGAVCAAPPGAEVDGCEALVAGPIGIATCNQGECFARLEFTGNQCGSEPDVTGEDLSDHGAGGVNCVSGGGVTVCASKQSTNCGTVNGEAFCVTSVPPAGCAALGSGALLCDAEAGTVPVIDSEPAAPDGGFAARSNGSPEPRDFDYYGAGTARDSEVPVVTSGPAAEEELGEESLTPLADLEGFDEVDAGEEISAVYAAFLDTEIGSFAAGVASSFPAGVCPTAEFEAFGDVYVIDAHCELVDDNLDELAALLGFVYAFGALVIVLRS